MDNIKVKPATERTAVSVATDEIDNEHHPLYKIEFGEDGVATLVSADNPLPTTSSKDDINRHSSLEESINELVLQMKLLNKYMAEGFDNEITEEDIL